MQHISYFPLIRVYSWIWLQCFPLCRVWHPPASLLKKINILYQHSFKINYLRSSYNVFGSHSPPLSPTSSQIYPLSLSTQHFGFICAKLIESILINYLPCKWNISTSVWVSRFPLDFLLQGNWYFNFESWGTIYGYLMTSNSGERHWSHVQSCFWVASVHGIWAQNCISYGLFLQSYFWIFWIYKSFGTQLLCCMIHGYGCLASNACQQFLLCGCLVIQLFWYGMQLLTFIWNLPPPISVTEQMSQFLMVMASSFLWWVGGEEMVLRAYWGGWLLCCKTALRMGEDWPHFSEWIFRKHSI